jgi:hypothetical protein
VHPFDVGASAEGAPGTGDDDSTNHVIAGGLAHNLRELIAHPIGERIQPLGAIQRDQANTTGAGEKDVSAQKFERSFYRTALPGRAGSA